MAFTNKRGFDDMESGSEDEHVQETTRFATRLIDDKTLCPNLLSMTPSERKRNIEMHGYRAFGYPEFYIHASESERDRRVFRGYENLNDITNVQLVDRDPYLEGKTVIRQQINVNCLKSTGTFSGISLDDILLSRRACTILRTVYGIHYPTPTQIQSEGGEDDEMDEYHPGPFNTPDGLSIKEYLKTLPSKYELILMLFRFIFGDLSDYVCVAGGFALSYYTQRNYGYEVGVGDIDLFIHSCNEDVANEIVRRLALFYTGSGRNIAMVDGENVIGVAPHSEAYSSEFGTTYERGNLSDDIDSIPMLDGGYDAWGVPIKIQIIKRIYSCPQEIITGFDIDCCCILANLDGQIWATDRGCFAIRNGYNVVDFNRMSPSYWYRFSKYAKRGFGVWIPFMDYFRSNAFLDINVMDLNRGSSNLLRFMYQINNDRRYHGMKEAKPLPDIPSDYGERSKGKVFKLDVVIERIEWKTLNPMEQRINTFNRVFLEDPKEWYPVYPEYGIEHFEVNQHDFEIIPIDPMVPHRYVVAKNIKRMKREKPFSARAKDYCHYLTMRLSASLPGAVVFGAIPRTAITGISELERAINVWIPDSISDTDRVMAMYSFYVDTLTRSFCNIMAANGIDISSYHQRIFMVRYCEDAVEAETISEQQSLLKFAAMTRGRYPSYLNKGYLLYRGERFPHKNDPDIICGYIILSDEGRELVSHALKIDLITRLNSDAEFIKLQRHIQFLEANSRTRLVDFRRRSSRLRSDYITSEEVANIISYLRKYDVFALDTAGTIVRNLTSMYPTVDSLRGVISVAREISPRINVTVSGRGETLEHFLDSNDTARKYRARSVMVRDGSFYGEKYYLYRLIHGLDGSTEVLSYPIIDNYVPN